MIIFVTGAGVSAESGLSTYRDDDGLWKKYDKKVFSTIGRVTHKEEQKRFFDELQDSVENAEPNEAHRVIAQFEEHFETMVITQNIDDLHERAGSTNVVHVHGSIIPDKDGVRDIVLFGEAIKYRKEIKQALAKCTTLIYVGTSGSVHPVCDFVKDVKCRTVEVNTKDTSITDHFHQVMRGKASEMLPQLLRYQIADRQMEILHKYPGHIRAEVENYTAFGGDILYTDEILRIAEEINNV